MKKILTFFTMLLLVGHHLLHAAEKDNLIVTYIANEGFLIEGSGRKILIDALHGKDYISESDVPSAETLNNLSNAQPPFDDVDVIFVTHQHQDHFDSSLVMSYLINNNHCHVVGPQQVVDQLKSFREYALFENQIHSVTPLFANTQNLSINGIEFSAMRLKHISKYSPDEQTGESVDRHKNIQNLGFLISIGSHNILHIGDSDLRDAEEEYKLFRLAQEKIDIAFLTHWFVQLGGSNVSSYKIINNYIKPQRVVLMHFNKRSLFQYVNYYIKHLKYFISDKFSQNKLPPVTIFKQELERKVFFD